MTEFEETGMKRGEYIQRVREARQREQYGHDLSDDDRRFLKAAKEEGLDPASLNDDDQRESDAWDGSSSAPSQTPTEPTEPKSPPARRKPARSTANPSTKDPEESGTAQQATTSGPATGEDVKPSDESTRDGKNERTG